MGKVRNFELIRSKSNERIILEFSRVVKNSTPKNYINPINKAKNKPTFFKSIHSNQQFFINVNNVLSTIYYNTTQKYGAGLSLSWAGMSGLLSLNIFSSSVRVG
jgi:hypothetical protein